MVSLTEAISGKSVSSFSFFARSLALMVYGSLLVSFRFAAWAMNGATQAPAMSTLSNVLLFISVFLFVSN
ncbi:Uncharacterised protein [Enterobacter cloacae]|nr:Uncharacterised protein [Enterobacter cloacae]